jgi:hypothetical protein
MTEVDQVRGRRELMAALDEVLATAAKQQAVLVAVSAPDLLAEVLRLAAVAGVECKDDLDLWSSA